jgi:hypothetical protein
MSEATRQHEDAGDRTRCVPSSLPTRLALALECVFVLLDANVPQATPLHHFDRPGKS